MVREPRVKGTSAVGNSYQETTSGDCNWQFQQRIGLKVQELAVGRRWRNRESSVEI
jgi:hypothetical protein